VSSSGRLGGWIGLVGLFSVLGYVSTLAGEKAPDDVFYRWSFSVGGVLQYAVVLGIVLALVTGRWELLALRRPDWRQAARLLLVPIGVAYAVTAALSPFLNPGEEQGLTTDHFDAGRAAPFVASVLVVTIAAPAVEELAFRGLGFSLLRPLGRWPAILLVGVAFGLWHGLFEAFLPLFAFGAGLAWLRERTGSVYPCIAAHAIFNGLAVVFSLLA
jgi:membrane protease YdiL (CAAX protease family)